MRAASLACFLSVIGLTACSEMSKLPAGADTGPDPALPPPTKTLIPTVNIAPAKGWPAGVTPKAAPGTQVADFATGLEHPRWLYVLPNANVLVAYGRPVGVAIDRRGALLVADDVGNVIWRVK